MIVFNNRRMLHGRRAFNRFNLLDRRLGSPRSDRSHLGNQDWARAPVALR